MDQPGILTRAEQDPTLRRSRGLDLGAVTRGSLLPSRTTRLPETTRPGNGQGGRRNPEGCTVIGVFDDQPILEDDRAYIRRRGTGALATSQQHSGYQCCAKARMSKEHGALRRDTFMGVGLI